MKILYTLSILVAFNASIFAQIKVIDNNNVGIHTDSPSSKVSVGDNGNSLFYFSIYSPLTATNSRALHAVQATGANSRYAIVGATTGGGGYARGIYGSATISTATNSGRAYGIYGVAGNSTSGYNYGTVGRLYGSNNGAGIYGTTSGADYNTRGKYAGFFYGSVKVTGSLTVSGTITSSDIKLKKGIKNLEKGSMDKIKQIKAIKYKLKTPIELAAETAAKSDTLVKIEMDPELEANFARERIGFSAQEVQLVYPELVVEGQDGKLGIDYVGLIPVLLEALKEQQAIIEEQQVTLKELQAAVGKLKKNK